MSRGKRDWMDWVIDVCLVLGLSLIFLNVVIAIFVLCSRLP